MHKDFTKENNGRPMKIDLNSLYEDTTTQHYRYIK
jgi:hypothetical protein